MPELSDSFLDAKILQKSTKNSKISAKPHRHKTPSNVFQCPNLSNSAIY